MPCIKQTYRAPGCFSCGIEHGKRRTFHLIIRLKPHSHTRPSRGNQPLLNVHGGQANEALMRAARTKHQTYATATLSRLMQAAARYAHIHAKRWTTFYRLLGVTLKQKYFPCAPEASGWVQRAAKPKIHGEFWAYATSMYHFVIRTIQLIARTACRNVDGDLTDAR